MLSNKIEKTFLSLQKDLKIYLTIHKKRVYSKNIVKQQELVKVGLNILNEISKDLDGIKKSFSEIAFYLNQNVISTDSINPPKKRKTRNHIKNSDKEPNENLINKRYMFSGGAWDSNRRKH